MWERKQQFWLWVLLLLYSGVIFTINLGSNGIYSAQEGRAAIIARNMIKSGNYLKIEIKGEPENEKPIFGYWLCAISGNIFGVNEFSVRLPSALAAIFCVLAATWLGMRIYGQTTGFFSGFILATMSGFVNLGRIARLDMIMCAFYAAAMLLLYEGYFRRRQANAWLYLFYVVLAVGMMVKGPVSVFLIILTVLVLIVMEWNWRKMLKMAWELKPISGLLIGLGVCIPWLLLECGRTGSNFFTDFFWVQNLDRFLGIETTFCEGRRKSFFYYFPKLFAMTLPWSVLVPFLLWQYRRAWKKLRPETWFLVIWVLTVFVFFSLSFIKRGDYILPLYPALAILIARYLVLQSEMNYHLTKYWKPAWGILLGIAIILCIAVQMGVFNHFVQLVIDEKVPHLASRDGMGMRDYLEIFTGAPWLLPALIILGFAALFVLGQQMQRGNLLKAIQAFLGIMLLVYCFYYLCLDPVTDRKKTTKSFCLRVQKVLPPDAKVAYAGVWVDEAVFFINRDYERLSHEELYDSNAGRFRFKYIFTTPEYFAQSFPQEWMNKLEKIDETAPEHHYPMLLVRVKEGN